MRTGGSNISHFSRLSRANITSKESFVAACKEVGLTEITMNTEITDWAGKREKVDVAARVDGRYSVGIQKAGKRWEMLCDWQMCRPSDAVRAKIGGSSGTDLADALLRYTTKHTLISTYRRQGFMARVTENPDKSLHISLSR